MTRARMTVPYLTLVLFVVAGGYVHLREWLDHYRYVPSRVPGAAVVRVGFPLDVAVSVGLAIVLLAIALHLVEGRIAPITVGATALFELSSLAVLILSRTGSVLGWSEHLWTPGADQSRVVEVGAVVTAAAIGVLGRLPRGWRVERRIRTTPGV